LRAIRRHSRTRADLAAACRVFYKPRSGASAMRKRLQDSGKGVFEVEDGQARAAKYARIADLQDLRFLCWESAGAPFATSCAAVCGKQP
jgi:hypothetical protein